MPRRSHFITSRSGLLFVEAVIAGPRGGTTRDLVLDTGATATTLVPEVMDVIGYSARDGYQRSRIRSAVGDEEGYRLCVAEFSALSMTVRAFPVHVFDLGYGVDGLLGLDFLRYFNFEIRPVEGVILAELIAR